MAISGLYFVFFVLFHMYGNLKILAGHEGFDHYAEHLRTMFMPILPYSGFLWIFRITLILALIAHVYSAITLWGRANGARSTRYAVKKSAAASISSKWMRWGSNALLLFIIFHLAQFTLMWVNVGGWRDLPSERVVLAFQNPLLLLIYVLAMLALAMHLHHGVWSASQTLGWTNTAKSRATAKTAGLAIAAIVVIGFLIPPFAIFFGIIN